MTDVIIREFAPGDENAFRQLNEEWISRYFVLEAKDLESLRDPKEAILDNGGRIFFAVLGDRIVGCCALLAMGRGEFEVAKMAVTEAAQGCGIGRRLLGAVVTVAHEAGAKRLYLETNRRLAPAIRLYESLGFQHLPPERIVPSAYARAEVYMELICA